MWRRATRSRQSHLSPSARRRASRARWSWSCPSAQPWKSLTPVPTGGSWSKQPRIIRHRSKVGSVRRRSSTSRWSRNAGKMDMVLLSSRSAGSTRSNPRLRCVKRSTWTARSCRTSSRARSCASLRSASRTTVAPGSLVRLARVGSAPRRSAESCSSAKLMMARSLWRRVAACLAATGSKICWRPRGLEIWRHSRKRLRAPRA
mmetsp:Transcript_138418/g.442357  ORF Transcript_138418/g.442357 Transcript_138418/m.442357 type:complete len:203 (-) Transcript_138418:3059-3667(-)